MRKIIVLLLSAVIVLTGCNQFNSILNKIHFTDKNSGSNEEESNSENLAEHAEDKNSTEDQIDGQDLAENSQESNDPTLDSEYFNKIKEVNGRNIIQNPNNILALVNKEFALPDDYEPNDLVRPNVSFSFGNQDLQKSYMRKEAAEHLEKMFAKATLDGIDLFAVSGYRSYERQVEVFSAQVNEVGEKAAEQVVAVPGNSEHQSGLSMDISGSSVGYDLVEEFGEKPEGKWLAANAHEFGFILRFPKGKEDITKYDYEPWHFRYVGVEAASVIYKKQLTLEEYFNIVEKI